MGYYYKRLIYNLFHLLYPFRMNIKPSTISILMNMILIQCVEYGFKRCKNVKEKNGINMMHLCTTQTTKSFYYL